MGSEIPDSFDPNNEVPQTLEGMLREYHSICEDLLKCTDKLLAVVEVGKPDPLIEMVMRQAELIQLQNMINVSLLEKLNFSW